MLGTTTLPAPQQLAGMGQIVVVTSQDLARAVLGSCVGVTIYDPGQKLGVLAHVVLPTSQGRKDSPGKFMDTAIPWMIETLQQRGAVRRRLVAKIAGGSKMFAAQGPFLIGEQNAQAARDQLNQLGIPLIGEHLGGAHGRRVTLSGDTGILTVELVGQSTTYL